MIWESGCGRWEEGGRRRERPPPNSDSDWGGGFGLQKLSPLLLFSLPPPEADVSNSNLLDTIRAKNRLGWMRRRREGGLSLPPWDTPAAEVAVQYFCGRRLGHGISYRVLKCSSFDIGTNSKYLVPPPKKTFFDEAPVERTSSPAKKNFFVWLTAHSVIAHIVYCSRTKLVEMQQYIFISW